MSEEEIDALPMMERSAYEEGFADSWKDQLDREMPPGELLESMKCIWSGIPPRCSQQVQERLLKQFTDDFDQFSKRMGELQRSHDAKVAVIVEEERVRLLKKVSPAAVQAEVVEDEGGELALEHFRELLKGEPWMKGE